MFFILSKTIYYILMPLVWIIGLFLFSLLTKNQLWKKRSFFIALIMLLLFTNGFIINELFGLWEKRSVPINSLKENQTAIVLGGVAKSNLESTDRVYFDKGADRVLHTVQLFKAGKISRIIISGGSGLLKGQKRTEAEQLRSVFLYCGVPDSAMILEDKSKNTRENALFTKRIIDSLKLKSDFLLITSAFHMRRAEACFKKAGLETKVFPVDFYSNDRSFTPDDLVIPSETALMKWAKLIHEVTGYITYKLMGYC